ncbi:MAG: hypothetical protein U9N32_07915, partial [Spirochaetota bacterium]|nr:hypothetical protein [Spirochaetota bacterium]
IYITFMVYAIVSIVWGPAGIVQTSKLQIYKEKLLQNTVDLSQISSTLTLQSLRLRTDHNLIALKARELGFFNEGEGKFIIRGYSKNYINYSVGSYYKKFNKEITNVKYFRMFSVIVGFMVYLIMSVFIRNYQYQSRKFK